MTKHKHHAPHPKEAEPPTKAADNRLDEALEESFPASDPIAVDMRDPHHLPVKGEPSGKKKQH